MYTTLFAFAAVGLLVGTMLLCLGRWLAPRPGPARRPFESGGNPRTKRWDRFGAGWLSLLPTFLMMMLACALLFPLAAAVASVGLAAALPLGGFLLPVLIGVVYAWREGMLQWH